MMSDSAKNLVGKIPGLIKAEIGENFADSDCDFVFYAEFEVWRIFRHFRCIRCMLPIRSVRRRM